MTRLLLPVLLSACAPGADFAQDGSLLADAGPRKTGPAGEPFVFDGTDSTGAELDLSWRLGMVPPGSSLTDRDIVVEVVSVGLDPGLVKLGDLLTQPLVTVDEDTGYAETIRLMSNRGVRRMPVVNKAGVLVGIISFDDLFHQLGIPLSELSGLAIREVRHEAETRR